MIAAALQLINSARSRSAKAWLGAIALVAMVAAAARLVTYGEHREAVRIASIARAETLRGISRRCVSHTLRRAPHSLNSPSRVPQPSRQALLVPTRVAPLSSLLPFRAPIYIAAAESLTATIPKLEAARAALDTVLLHQIQPPPDASFWLPASRTIKVGGALLVSYAVWSVWHQHSPSP